MIEAPFGLRFTSGLQLLYTSKYALNSPMFLFHVDYLKNLPEDSEDYKDTQGENTSSPPRVCMYTLS